MPFSRSRSIESMTRSATSWLARKAPVCHNMASTSVVLPWSTWATIATLRRSLRVGTKVRRYPLRGQQSEHDRDVDVGIRRRRDEPRLDGVPGREVEPDAGAMEEQLVEEQCVSW